jgi:hypothetical protein
LGTKTGALGVETSFQFGVEWQAALVKILMMDQGFGHAMAPFLQSKFFSNDVLSWAYETLRVYREEYGVFPGELVLAEKAKGLDPSIREVYVAGVEHLRTLPLADAKWVKDTAIDFVRRNVFVRAMRDARELYNAGQVEESYDLVQREMESVYATHFEPVSEAWFFEELPRRQTERWRTRTSNKVGTGIPELDAQMNGGLSLSAPSEFGLWMAYSSVGKTTMLVNLGCVACRAYYKQVAHFILEGDISTVEARYDTVLSEELYQKVKVGDLDATRYAMLQQEYQYLKRKLYIRALVEKWEYTVPDIWAIIQDKKNREGWDPDLIIVDYADLLVGHKKGYPDEYASNADAYRALKTITTKGKGYGVWSAAQAKKPKDENFDTKEHVLKSNMLSGRYEKVKVCDFLGSINATIEEREEGRIRLWVEKMRDNPRTAVIECAADFERMKFGQGLTLKKKADPVVPFNPADGPERHEYKPSLAYQQIRAGFDETSG